MFSHSVNALERSAYQPEYRGEKVVIHEIQYHHVREKAEYETTQKRERIDHEHTLLYSAPVAKRQQQNRYYLNTRNAAKSKLRSYQNGGEHSRRYNAFCCFHA
jgi:hypothetical protein